MIEDMRKYVEAGLGSLSPTRAREMARSMLQGQGSERVNRFAQDLMEWSKRGRERITELVQAEVKRQLRAVGVATRDDLDALRRRVRELEKEKAAPSTSSGSRSGSAAKRSTTRKSTARKSPAKKSTARRSTAKRSSSSSSGSSATQGSTGTSSGSSSSS